MKATILGGKAYDLPFEERYTCVYDSNPSIEDIASSNLLVFTGGSDVDSWLYGEPALPTTMIDGGRDRVEEAVYNECIHHNIPMVGICRGGQFLNVMNGGSLIQHQTEHCRGGGHEMHTDIASMWVTSTHHQMMRITEDAVLLAWANECDGMYAIEPEVVFYRETQSLCVQYHPEYMDPSSDGWLSFQDLIGKYILPYGNS